MAVLARDQMQHHVERRRSAGRGPALAVDDEEAVFDGDLGELLAEGIEAFPMRRRAMLIEQPRPAEEETPRIHGAEIDAGDAQPAQPLRQTLIEIALGRKARADDRHVVAGMLGYGAIGDQRHAVRGDDRLAVAAQDIPAIEPSLGQAIGDAQGFDGGNERHHRELRHQQEADRIFAVAGGALGHVSSDSWETQVPPRLSLGTAFWEYLFPCTLLNQPGYWR